MTREAKEPSLKIGDKVRPRPEWQGDANLVPSGRVRRIEAWGNDCVAYIGSDHRAFVASAFKPVRGQVR